MIIKFITFTGEIPRLPPHLLPDNAATFASNCDFLHGELRGHLNWSLVSVLPTYLGAPIVSVWTENGVDFFGWPYEVVAVKSPVINDPFHRIYYAAVPLSGPVLKLARTAADDGQIINARVPNFFPPESQDVALNSLASWLLGVPLPQAQGNSVDEKLGLSLYDLPSWPLMPNLGLRATFFLEDTSGAIVYQQDISNLDQGVDPNTGLSLPQVIYTQDSAVRDTHNKIQDMLWPLGWKPRPYKYYWFTPPDVSALALSRTVTITNTDASNNPYVITYGDSSVTPPVVSTGGTQGGEA